MTSSLDKKLKSVIDNLKGIVGIAVEKIDGSFSYSHKGREIFPTASIIKVPILVHLFEKVRKGEVALDDTLRVKRNNFVKGSGVIQYLHAGLELTLHDLATLMIILSDNYATNILIDVCTIDGVNKYMKELGLKKTVLYRKVNFNLDLKDPKWLGETTPCELNQLLLLLGRKEILIPALCDECIAIMKNQEYDSMLPRMLPGYGIHEIDGGEDYNPEFVIAHKTGAITGSRSDAGLIFSKFGDYAITLFTKELTDNRYFMDNEGVLALAQISGIVYDYLKSGSRKR